jgi:hypothetical protein
MQVQRQQQISRGNDRKKGKGNSKSKCNCYCKGNGKSESGTVAGAAGGWAGWFLRWGFDLVVVGCLFLFAVGGWLRVG